MFNRFKFYCQWVDGIVVLVWLIYVSMRTIISNTQISLCCARVMIFEWDEIFFWDAVFWILNAFEAYIQDGRLGNEGGGEKGEGKVGNILQHLESILLVVS